MSEPAAERRGVEPTKRGRHCCRPRAKVEHVGQGMAHMRLLSVLPTSDSPAVHHLLYTSVHCTCRTLFGTYWCTTTRNSGWL